MHIIKYLQLPLFFDSSLLQQDVDALSAMPWQPHYQVKHYDGEWSAIPLRSIGGQTNNVIVSPVADAHYCDTIFLDKSPYLKQVLQQIKCPLLAVRLLKLNAGSIIKEHRDAELNFEKGEIRLHIPVYTDPAVEFLLDKEPMELKAGECWYMNFNLPHSLHNKSNINRVHLVIDAVVNDWVTQLFADPRCPVKKEIEDSAGKYDVETKKQMIQHFRLMNTALSNQMADDLEKSLA